MINRRRPTPWLHRWSRFMIAGIAAVGAVGTGYLTVLKLSGGTAACPTSGCEQVLNSPYGTVFGLPLTLFGFLGYFSMGVMAIAPLLINLETQKDLRRTLDNLTWLGLFIGAAAMTVFSAYLMYLLAFVLKALCIYCIASAIFSFSFLALTILGKTWEDGGQLLFTGVIVAMVTLIGTLGIYANVGRLATPATDTPGQAGPPITTTSGPTELALAQHLKQNGAKMYGAYWCPHCHDQKQLFGQEAFKAIDYIECDPSGKNSQVEVCKAQAENVKGYPTWEVNGKFYSGTQSLAELADLSSYQGPRNFQNSF